MSLTSGGRRLTALLLPAAAILMLGLPSSASCAGSGCDPDGDESAWLAACGEKDGCILCSAECRQGHSTTILECDYACGGAQCPPPQG